MSGAGTITLSGNNTFNGGTSENAGSLIITNFSALGAGTLTVGSASATQFLEIATTGLNTLSNNIVLPNDTTANTIREILMTGNANDVFTLGGTISGGGTGTILYFNNGSSGDASRVFHLSGTNTFTGSIEINRGSISIDSDAGLGPTSNALLIDSNNNAYLGFNNSFTYTHNTSSLDSTFAFNTNANNVIDTGSITTANAAYTFSKLGSGTLTLTNNNTYTAGTIVAAGTLATSGAGTIGSGALAVNSTAGVSSQATLVNNQTVAGLSGTATGGGTIAISLPTSGTTLSVVQTASNSFGGPITGSGGFTLGNRQHRDIDPSPVKHLRRQHHRQRRHVDHFHAGSLSGTPRLIGRQWGFVQLSIHTDSHISTVLDVERWQQQHARLGFRRHNCGHGSRDGRAAMYSSISPAVSSWNSRIHC